MSYWLNCESFRLDWEYGIYDIIKKTKDEFFLERITIQPSVSCLLFLKKIMGGVETMMKRLKQSSRAELLEMLLAQTKETERLEKELEETQQLLTDRNLHIQNAGNLAQATLQINGVMEAAQAAAQQYLDNIIQMEKETKEKCHKLIEEAKKQAEQIKKDTAEEGG